MSQRETGFQRTSAFTDLFSAMRSRAVRNEPTQVTIAAPKGVCAAQYSSNDSRRGVFGCNRKMCVCIDLSDEYDWDALSVL